MSAKESFFDMFYKSKQATGSNGMLLFLLGLLLAGLSAYSMTYLDIDIDSLSDMNKSASMGFLSMLAIFTAISWSPKIKAYIAPWFMTICFLSLAFLWGILVVYPIYLLLDLGFPIIGEIIAMMCAPLIIVLLWSLGIYKYSNMVTLMLMGIAMGITDFGLILLNYVDWFAIHGVREILGMALSLAWIYGLYKMATDKDQEQFADQDPVLAGVGLLVNTNFLATYISKFVYYLIIL